jgi:hypothetical protein
MSVIQVMVDGETVVVDPRSMTGRERAQARSALIRWGRDNEVEPDETDATYAAIWIMLRRARPDVTIDEVFDAVTQGDLEDAAEVDRPEV